MNPTLTPELQFLDSATGGVFSAPTSGERAARLKAWLTTLPDHDAMQAVYKELSARDKGAAKALRERLDEIKRERHQDELIQEWVQKGDQLRQSNKMSLAQALAWQRDAAKAGAPLSREPLAGIKQALNDRIRHIEDLQHRAQVLRESAVLLGQRSEVLATKPWQEAAAQREVLGQDVNRWLSECEALTQDREWFCVDPKFPPLLQANAQQVRAVFDAFGAALDLAHSAAADATLPLPPVPTWAEEIRLSRSQPGSATEAPAKVAPAKPRIDPALRAQAVELVQPLLQKLEQELAEGHGKASAGAANALRQVLREQAAVLPERMEHQAQLALSAASELEGWQRWRADQLRAELVAKAEALFKPAPAAAEGEAAPEPQPIFGGRKMQEALRELREQWKLTDQGGMPNHALWKKFDQACNRAYKVVESWHDKTRAEAGLHREARLKLIAEVQDWTQQHAQGPDWKAVTRQLAQFSERWREAGHVSEKVFAELQPLWKAAYQAAHAPLDEAHKAGVARRQALIDEALALSQRPGLPLDQIKALQQRWQAESHAMALDRRTEQKLWDAFRAPIDALFQRKSQERAQSAAALSAHDRNVMDAAQALEAACKAGDAAAIRSATQALQDASRGVSATPVAQPTPPVMEKSEVEQAATESEPTQQARPQPERKVVAVRGDDRPGMKKTEPAAPVKGARNRSDRPERADRFDRRRDAPADGLSSRPPRLGDAAFRAMRHAQDMAEQALRKLTAQAHGEVLTQVLNAWKARSAEQLPAARELGGKLSPSQRQAWAGVLSRPATSSADDELLRLEIAAQVPTPAAHLEARRAMQLKLLTQRHQAAPADTWAQDVEKVLSSAHADEAARRLQTVLKVFLR